jgi:glycosyltransferase involved in cell wall biosynthesis
LAEFLPGDLGEIPEISVITPIFNEEKNIPLLLEKLVPVLDATGKAYEIIAVNDGSQDGSLALLRASLSTVPQLRIVNFRRNFGQTAAMMAGFDYARGEIIVAIDADLQNDPEDIPLLIAKLNEGYDVASGWRRDRQDARIRRNFVSRVANRLISWISGVTLQDYGCTLKAYRADVIKGVRLYGEMHRFIPIYASWLGARVVEVPVRHYARQFGKSNYGLERIVKVVLDLMVVKFMHRYMVKPMYVFGGFGILALIAATLSFILMIGMRVFGGISMISTPLPLFVVMNFLIGILSLLMGLLAEIMTRTYFESQQRTAYLVGKVYEAADGT